MITKHKPALAWLIVLGFLLLPLLPADPLDASPGQATNVAEFVEVEGYIDPVTERFLISMIDRAESENSALIILRLDTPGGIGVSVSDLTRRIFESKVPVVVWVAPAGAKAWSSGAFLASASHVLVMSNGSSLGGAETRILERAGNLEAGALLQSFSDRGRRSAEYTRALLSDRGELTAREAASKDDSVILADTTAALVARLQEGDIRVDGKPLRLSDSVNLRFHKMSLLDQLLHSSARPSIAYLLILLGLFGLVFELYNPGIGGAGLTGSVALGFGMYALSVLPTSWPAAALVAVGLGLYLADLHHGSLGIASALGSVALISGSILLFPGEHGLRLQWWVVAGGVTAVAIFFISVMTAAIKARTAKPIAGSEGIVGMSGTARTDIAPEGQVMAKGTLWRARTVGVAIPEGAEVEILGVSGLVLIVEMKSERAEGS